MVARKAIMRVLFAGFILFLLLIAVEARICTPVVHADEKNYYRLVILGDPHLPGKEIPAKESVVQNINSWDDVDMVVVLGDICFELGTSEEYAYAKQFFSQLKKPVCFINGNHDYIYDNVLDSKGRKRKADSRTREKKLKLFKETFDLPQLYYTKKAGNYLLFFLAVDDLSSSDLARISQGQLDWLRSELDQNKKLPTIVFFTRHWTALSKPTIKK
jgi:predicted MPP superfamily phosphohydrolase